MTDERPADSGAEEATTPEPDEAAGAGEPSRPKPSGVLGKTVSVASGAARGSASGVFRGADAATRGGVALAEGALRVTYWPALLCVLGAILLQVRLPDKLTVGPDWLLPSLEGALLLALFLATMRGTADAEHSVRRRFAIGMIALVNAGNAASLYLLIHELLHKHITNGRPLILSGIAIWLTNILIFALWYWQLDRGGPVNRARHPDPTTPEGHPDWIFPEMDTGKPYTPEGWLPSFLDYLALAVTTATAFGPADAMPNSQRAKVLMSIQALISLATLGLIIARAVGILG